MLIKLKIIRNNIKHSPKDIDEAMYKLFADTLYTVWNEMVYNSDAFTVVGSPTITDDGVASGFSISNYINIPNTYAVTSTSNTEFNISISKTSNPSAYSPFMRVAKNNYRGTFGFLLGITTEGYLYTSGIIERSHAQLDNNRLYNIKLKCVEGVASVYLDGDLLYSDTYTKDVPTGYITIGAGAGRDYFQNGSIDLKQFSITVDGKKVFSGSKSQPMEMTFYYKKKNYGIVKLGQEKNCFPIPTGVKANFVEVK